MAELADAYGSGPYELRLVKVQVLSPAPSELIRLQQWGLFSCRWASSSLLAPGTCAPPTPSRSSLDKLPLGKIDLRWRVSLCQKGPSMASESHFWPPLAFFLTGKETLQGHDLRFAKIGLQWQLEKCHGRPKVAWDFATKGGFWLFAANGGRFWHGEEC